MNGVVTMAFKHFLIKNYLRKIIYYEFQTSTLAALIVVSEAIELHWTKNPRNFYCCFVFFATGPSSSSFSLSTTVVDRVLLSLAPSSNRRSIVSR